MDAVMKKISSMYPEHSWELMSRRSARSVHRLIRKGEVEYYVKILSPRTLPERLRNLIHPKTLREASMLDHLMHAGIPVPEVCGHVRAGSSSALITRAVFPARSLFEESRQRQIEVMLDMGVRLLNAGFGFSDMHLGNIILNRQSSPFLVDAYEIVPLKKTALKHASSLFAQVVNIFDLSREELEPYLMQTAGIGEADAAWEMIRSQALSLRRKQVGRRVARSLREGSFSRAFLCPQFRAFVNRNHSPDLHGLVAAHRAHLAGNTNLYKVQKKTQLSTTGEYCIKSYAKAGLFAAPYAVRSWKGSLTLLFNGVPVAEPVAVIVFRNRESMLITRDLDQPDLDRFLAGGYSRLPLGERRSLAQALGGFVGSLHAKGIYHADLKACNIKICTQPVQFYLLDTDRVEHRKALSLKRRLKNLVQINTSIPREVSRTARMAFLKSYCAITGDDPGELFKDIWRLSSGSEVIYRCDTGDVIEQWRENP